MCSERDCKIFRGMIIACDSCDRLQKRAALGRKTNCGHTGL